MEFESADAALPYSFQYGRARSSINSATTQYDANGDGKVGRCVVGGVWGGTVVIGCE